MGTALNDAAVILITVIGVGAVLGFIYWMARR